MLKLMLFSLILGSGCWLSEKASASSWVLDRSEVHQADGSTVTGSYADWRINSSAETAWLEVVRGRLTSAGATTMDRLRKTIPALRFNSNTNEVVFVYYDNSVSPAKKSHLVCGFEDYMTDGTPFFVSSGFCPVRTFDYGLNGTRVIDSTVYFMTSIYFLSGGMHRNLDCTSEGGTPMYFEPVNASATQEICFVPRTVCPTGWTQRRPSEFLDFVNDLGLKGASLCQ